MKKPLLLLDVDGVLNVPGRDCKDREIRLQWRPESWVSFWPNANSRNLMEMAWRLYNVRWLTAWGKTANCIARYWALPERPALRDRGGDEWKATAVARALNSWDGPVAWIEDGITEAAHALVKARGWSYFHCDPYVGVTEAHINGLREFALSSMSRRGTVAPGRAGKTVLHKSGDRHEQ